MNTLKLLKVSNEAKILHKVLLYPAIEKAQYSDLFVRLPMIYAERMKVTFRQTFRYDNNLKTLSLKQEFKMYTSKAYLI